MTFLIYRKNRNNPKLPLQIIGCILGTFMLVQFGMYSTIRQNSRRNFKKELKQLDLTKTEIKINGVRVDFNPEKVVNELLSVDNLRDHHSGPINELKFEINDGRTKVEFELGRDSELKTEYWLDINNRNIGKIRTRLFNEIK